MPGLTMGLRCRGRPGGLLLRMAFAILPRLYVRDGEFRRRVTSGKFPRVATPERNDYRQMEQQGYGKEGREAHYSSSVRRHRPVPGS